MCGWRSSILHYGPLIETNYLYAPTQSPSASLNKSKINSTFIGSAEQEKSQLSERVSQKLHN